MERTEADQQIWQHKPVQVEVVADAFLSVSPYLPADLRVEKRDGCFIIAGHYGMDTFREHSFQILVDGAVRTFRRFEDIPQTIDNVVDFNPDDTHDLTFFFTFEREGETFIHSHWVHHDMEPWEHRLTELVARETNGGWNARSHKDRRPRRLALLGDGSSGGVS